MKPRSLRSKILCLAALNLLLLGVVLILFARLQFRLGPESLLLGPARDRIVALANVLRLDLDATLASARAALLAAYGKRYDAEFFLTDPMGRPLDGATVALPPGLMERMRPAGPLNATLWTVKPGDTPGVEYGRRLVDPADSCPRSASGSRQRSPVSRVLGRMKPLPTCGSIARSLRSCVVGPSISCCSRTRDRVHHESFPGSQRPIR